MADKVHEFVDDVVSMDSEDATVAARVPLFSETLALEARAEGWDTTLKIPTKPPRLVIDVASGGTLEITRWGALSDLREGYSFFGGQYRGEDVDEGVKSYLAAQIRHLLLESYHLKIGARDTPPGITLTWRQIYKAGKLTYKAGKYWRQMSDNDSSGSV